jgi:hypothetical protein
MTDFQTRLDTLVDEYLTIGCPCRFPRFRAITARKTVGIGGGSFTSEDQRGLILAVGQSQPSGAGTFQCARGLGLVQAS